MKHHITILMVLAAMLGSTTTARAYDFSAPATSNHTLYFNISDSTNHYVTLTNPDQNGNYIIGDLVVPATVQHGGASWTVRAVGHAAFLNCHGMTSCVLPETIVSIGRYNAFGQCHNMTSITLPASLKGIGQYAFYGCDGLQEVHYTGTAEQWCHIRFDNWNSNPLEQAHTLYIGGEPVVDLVLQEGLDTIRLWAFLGCDMRSVSIPRSVRFIENFAFQNCDSLTIVYYNCDSCSDDHGGNWGDPIISNCPNLTTLVFGDSVRNVPSNLLSGTPALATVVFPDVLETIGADAFFGCRQLRTVDFSHTALRSIGNSAFRQTGIVEVVLPRTCTLIGEQAFSDDTSMQRLVIRAESVSWGWHAFWHCNNLKNVRMYSAVPPTIAEAGNEIPGNVHLVVPCGTATTYATPDSYNWDHITDVEEMPSVSVSVGANDGGTATILQEPTCDDMTAIVEAVADSGYHFIAWSDGDTNVQRTISVDTTDIALTSYFIADNPVGIDVIDGADATTVRVVDRRIVVDGPALTVAVFDMMGRAVGPNEPLHAGVYIVKIGMTTTRKVLIY